LPEASPKVPLFSGTKYGMIILLVCTQGRCRNGRQ